MASHPDPFHRNPSRRRTARIAVAAAVLAAGTVVAGCSTPSAQATTAPSLASTTSSAQVTTQTTQGPGAALRTVIAVGEGRVTARPDLLTVTLGVATSGSSAAEALQSNNARAAALLEVLRAGRIADDDVQTSSLQVSPVYDKDDQRITGYRVANTVTVKLRDLGSAGAVLDAVTKAAGDATRIQGLEFGFADPAAQRDRARADAVRQARTQAEQMAQAAGVALGPVLTITDAPGGEDPSRPYPAAAVADGAGRVPLAAGTLDTSVQVQVTFLIG